MNLDTRIIYQRIKDAEASYEEAKKVNSVANVAERAAEVKYYETGANEDFSLYLMKRGERNAAAHRFLEAEKVFNNLVRDHIKPAYHYGSGCK